MNYGFIEPSIEEDNWILGSNTQVKGVDINPSGDWRPYKPAPERQYNLKGVETMNCSVFGTLNRIETLLRFMGVNEDYSDRLLGILAGTTRQGGDPHKVDETIRKCGLAPDAELPFSESISSFGEYYSPNPPPKSLLDTCKLWLLKWAYRHEWVFKSGTLEYKREQLLSALKRGPVSVSVSAWQIRPDGTYYKGGSDNHWVLLLHGDGKYWYIFDQYEPFEKTLEWDYDFGFSKISYLNPALIDPNSPSNVLIGWLSSVASWLSTLFRIAKIDKPQPQEPTPEPQPAPESAPQPKYDWSMPEKAKRSVRLICDEEALTPSGKDLICAVIQAESGFDIKAFNRNVNGTADWGICQFNDGPRDVPPEKKWWIGPQSTFAHIQEVLENPEKCVRVMIQQYKAGNLRYWVAYTSGAYKKYL